MVLPRGITQGHSPPSTMAVSHLLLVNREPTVTKPGIGRDYSPKCYRLPSIIIRRLAGKRIDLGQEGNRISAGASSRPGPGAGPGGGTQGPSGATPNFLICETSGAFEHESGRSHVPSCLLPGPFGTGVGPRLGHFVTNWDILRHFWDTSPDFSHGRAASMRGILRQSRSALFCHILPHFLRRWPTGREEVDPAWIHGRGRAAGLARGGCQWGRTIAKLHLGAGSCRKG